ncbi:MAG: transporter substrate-binding protein [Campylobacterota bacterium]|nr:transporter substrate-binding protein [Campylobacterota bacterium]
MKFTLIVFSILVFIALSIFAFIHIKEEPIVIGLIHSKTGVMAKSEKSVLDVTLFSIEQINRSGGLLGREIVAVVKDGKSSDDGYKEALQELLHENITTIFGGWTSSSRKAMIPLLEKSNALLFYPLQYEGFESSKNIIYLGLTPNQQIVPTINYATKNFGTDAFLIGNDYIFPRVANRFTKEIARYFSMNIVGEEYRLLSERDFKDVAINIKKSKPSFILNTLNGDSNMAFFKALKDANISIKDTPVFSLSLTQVEVKEIAKELGIEAIEGSYATWGYFDSLEGKKNEELKKQFRKKFDNDIAITDPMHSAFLGVKLWAKSVDYMKKSDTSSVMNGIKGSSVDGNGDVMFVSEIDNHTWRSVRIAKVDDEAILEVVWDTESIQEAKPFPRYIDSNEIKKYIGELYKKWGNNYEAKVQK